MYDFLVVNSLLLKVKYKLCVSTLFTSIPFVFASIFKFILRGLNPGNSPLLTIVLSLHSSNMGRNCFDASQVSREKH